MRRLLAFAASFLIISVVPVCAQRGGGHASGGSHGGFSGGHASFSGSHGSFGGHGGFAGHSGFVGHSMGGHAFSGSHFVAGSRSFGWGRHGGVRFRTYGYGRYGYPHWGYGYPSGYYAGIDPYWWWDTYSDDSNDADQRAMANEMNEENLEEQQQLREQDQDLYARPMNRPHPAPAQASEQALNEPATVLVYRDQHQREIRNYAIVDGLLYNFTPQRTEKIPLAILDIPATKMANENRGVEFHLPSGSEGQ